MASTYGNQVTQELNQMYSPENVLANQQRQQQVQQQNALAQIMQKHRGDVDAALSEIAQVSPEYAFKVDAMRKAQAAKLAEQNKPMVLGAGGVVYDPQTRQPIFTAPTKPEKLPDWKDPAYLRYQENLERFKAGLKVKPASTTSPSGVQTPATDFPKLTEAQAKATTFVSQMAAASNELADIETNSKPSQGFGGQMDVWMAGGLTNPLSSNTAQRIKQAQNQWSESFLRVKTGAAATDPEVKLNNQTFFPQPGDSQPVIDQKARMRKQAERDVANMAGAGQPLATHRTEDEEALDWAMNNPTDPRSAAIIKKITTGR